MSDGFEDIGPDTDYTPTTPVEDVVKKARDFYNKKEVKDTVRKAEKLLKVAKDVKTGNPFSLLHGGFRIAEILYEFEKVTTPPALRKFNLIEAKAENLCNESVTSMAVSLFFDRDRIEEIESSPSSSGSKTKGPTLYRYMISPKIPLYWFQDNFEYSKIVCPNEHDIEAAKEAMAQLFWKRLGFEVEMLWGDSRDFVFREKAPIPWRYEGDFGYKLIRRWKKAYDMKMRRFIILHGPPGTGKSTLVRQLGADLKAKILYVPTQTLLDCNSIKLFSDALALVSPSVVIIDDIDRMSRNDLDKLLTLFEETETQIPLLLATTNHLDKLPGAIKRPGRFDEIWEISPPPPEVRPRVIAYFGTLENVVLTEEQIAAIDKIAGKLELSGAHIREIIRRMLLEDIETWDWNDLKFDDRDLTFSGQWRPADYVPEGLSSGEYLDEDEDEDYE